MKTTNENTSAQTFEQANLNLALAVKAKKTVGTTGKQSDALQGTYQAEQLAKIIWSKIDLATQLRENRANFNGQIQFEIVQYLGEKQGTICIPLLNLKVQPGQQLLKQYTLSLATPEGRKVNISGTCNVRCTVTTEGSEPLYFGHKEFLYKLKLDGGTIKKGKQTLSVDNVFSEFVQARIFGLFLEVIKHFAAQTNIAQIEMEKQAETAYRKLGSKATLEELTEFAANFSQTTFAAKAAQRAEKMKAESDAKAKAETTAETLQA